MASSCWTHWVQHQVISYYNPGLLWWAPRQHTCTHTQNIMKHRVLSKSLCRMCFWCHWSDLQCTLVMLIAHSTVLRRDCMHVQVRNTQQNDTANASTANTACQQMRGRVHLPSKQACCPSIGKSCALLDKHKCSQDDILGAPHH